MISWILKFLSNAAQHLPAGIYIQSFIGQSLKTCWVSSCSITTITAAIFQFLSSGSPFSKVCRSSTNFTRDTRNPAALGWSRSSLSLTKTLLSMMPSMTSSIVIPKNFWKTEAAPGFSSWLPKRMTVVPSDSFCGRLSWQSPFSPSRQFWLSLSMTRLVCSLHKGLQMTDWLFNFQLMLLAAPPVLGPRIMRGPVSSCSYL